MFSNWNQIQASLLQWKSIIQPEASLTPTLLPQAIRISAIIPNMSKEAAVMVVYDKENQLVLSEQRTREDRAYFGERIFLSGLVEEDEKKDPSLTAKRELNEELGIEVSNLSPLNPDGPIIGDLGEHIYPFIIFEWEGEIPEKVIGNNNPLSWNTLEEATTSSILSRVAIANLAIKYLLQHEQAHL